MKDIDIMTFTFQPKSRGQLEDELTQLRAEVAELRGGGGCREVSTRQSKTTHAAASE